LNSGRKAKQKDFNRDSQIWAPSREDFAGPAPLYGVQCQRRALRWFQAMKTAQGIIDRLFFDRMKARDVAQSFEPCRNFNSCISNSPCDLGILQFHHRHSVKIYPKLFITIRHAITTLNIGGVVQCKLPYALYSIQDNSVAATIELRRAWLGEDVTIFTIVLYNVSGSEAIVELRLHYRILGGNFNVLTLLR
jgi:hypothetical protein